MKVCTGKRSKSSEQSLIYFSNRLHWEIQIFRSEFSLQSLFVWYLTSIQFLEKGKDRESFQ